MSQPEIFRRCSACGGSFRAGALFCPQCGNPTAKGTVAPGPDLKQRDVEQVLPQNVGRRRPDERQNIPESRLADGPVPAVKDTPEGRVKPQVDKLRRASSVVIDEAAYDPSVRFVLVAGLLFLVFLVLLILSKWLG